MSRCSSGSTPPMDDQLPFEPARAASHISRTTLWVVVVSVGLTVVLYLVPYGRTVAWPLVLLSTLVHELGHGVAAIVAGGRFELLEVWSDGSGAAHYSGDFGRLASAFVAGGGLLGPAAAAAFGFAAGRSPRAARGGLLVLGAGLLVAEIMVIRTLFGLLFVGLLAVTLIALGGWARPLIVQLVLVFIAVQLALSVFARGDYLFTRTAQTAAGPMPSDTAQMAAALWLPFWFWGALCGIASVAVLLLGLRALGNSR